MLSRWEHAQRPGGTREKSLSEDPSEPRTCNRQTKGQKEPEVRALVWEECAVLPAGMARVGVTVRARAKVATAQGSACWG
jgi:hypothetical protein